MPPEAESAAPKNTAPKNTAPKNPAPKNRVPAARPITSARMKLLVAFCAAVIVGAAAALIGWARATPLIGWDVLALVYGGWLWFTVWRLDPARTEAEAKREDPGRNLTDLVLLCAAAASLVAVGVILFGESSASELVRFMRAGLALVSVFVSWTIVHTVYTLKYARLYYSEPPGGIDFNGSGPPDYTDFAYLAFTIGMTFQVSDTAIGSRDIRRAALRHAWLSFPLDVVIIATCVNLVSGLVKLAEGRQ
jgi:uncharacterized membrane protein